jgi:hypothetical protein
MFREPALTGPVNMILIAGLSQIPVKIDRKRPEATGPENSTSRIIRMPQLLSIFRFVYNFFDTDFVFQLNCWSYDGGRNLPSFQNS